MSTMKEAFREINRTECFGYSPTSSSIKPAHIANGWFRCILGKRYDPALLNQTVVHWTQNGEINPSEKLLSENPSVFEPFQPVSRRRDFGEFRADLKQLISPVGGAVNKGNRQSSYNITCEQHITEDYNDWGTGAFLYHLLAADFGEGPSPALELLKGILAVPTDEVSAITVPLVAQSAATDFTVGTYPAEHVFKRRGKAFQSATLNQIRAGFDNLAAFETTYGGGLDALRRLVAFGGFAVLMHMHNRCTEREGKAGFSPILLHFSDSQASTAYQASHATYNLSRRAIETLYTGLLKEWLEPRIGTRPTPKKCEQFIGEMEFGHNEDDKTREQMLKSYGSFASQFGGLDAMAEALRETIFRDLSGTPLDFYRAVGVRSGFVRPAGNRAVRKYYTLEGVLLEALLASVLPEGEMTYLQFLDQCYERYGLLIGGRSDDSAELMAQGIGTATVQDLRLNSQNFRQQLLSLGWARRYADGVLMVQVPEGLR
jgi:hypothetical protein